MSPTTYPKHSNDVVVLHRACTVEIDGFDTPAYWRTACRRLDGWYSEGGYIADKYVEDWIEMVAWSDLKNLSVMKSENWALQVSRDGLLKQRDYYKKECERLSKIVSRNLPRSADDGDHFHHRHGEGAVSDGPGTPGWPDPQNP